MIFNLFFSLSYAAEKILSCKMNYGISGENDETDIEFKNLSTIDQTQTFFLDLDKKWLSVKSQKDSIENGNSFNKVDFKIIYCFSKLYNNQFCK